MLEGEYVPSTAQWVRDQVEAFERAGGQRANRLSDTGLPIIVVTMRRNTSGAVRKLRGEERARWWERVVAAYPPHVDLGLRIGDVRLDV